MSSEFRLFTPNDDYIIRNDEPLQGEYVESKARPIPGDYLKLGPLDKLNTIRGQVEARLATLERQSYNLRMLLVKLPTSLQEATISSELAEALRSVL